MPTLHLGRAVGPSAGHPRRAQRLHRLLRAAQEPPVPPAAAGLRRQRRGAGRRRDGDAVLCRARAEGRQAAGRHHPAGLLHRRRRQRADVADAVASGYEQGRRLVRRHDHDGRRHGAARSSSARATSTGSWRSRSSPASASAPTTACRPRSWPTSSTRPKAATPRARPAPISACGRSPPSSPRRSARQARCRWRRCWASTRPRACTAPRR